LAGYSFGARLALRWLTEFPERWHGALLLSVNPGNFQTDEERARRREEDLRWARAWREEPWDDILRQWNAREIFDGAAQPERKEQDYDKHRLGEALERFSVSEQFTDTERLPARIQWLAGANDPKFCALLESMRQAGFPGTFEIIGDASHRLLHEAPTAVAAALDRLTA
jgi:2-succinyl-6-hydroxy-2,4-cyclohexadiene-1-carboxylate synthase